MIYLLGTSALFLLVVFILKHKQNKKEFEIIQFIRKAKYANELKNLPTKVIITKDNVFVVVTTSPEDVNEKFIDTINKLNGDIFRAFFMSKFGKVPIIQYKIFNYGK